MKESVTTFTTECAIGITTVQQCH